MRSVATTSSSRGPRGAAGDLAAATRPRAARFATRRSVSTHNQLAPLSTAPIYGVRSALMQTPDPDSHYLKFVKFASYTARRLQRAGHESLAKDVLRSRNAVRAAGRAWDDTDDAVQDGYADRDAADDTLDLLAQNARTALAGRSVDAPTTEPYTLVFPDGIDYYTIAPLDEEVSRYEELVARLKKHLPASDNVRKSTVGPVEKGIKEYELAPRRCAKR
jgi:hypothetical protein